MRDFPPAETRHTTSAPRGRSALFVYEHKKGVVVGGICRDVFNTRPEVTLLPSRFARAARLPSQQRHGQPWRARRATPFWSRPTRPRAPPLVATATQVLPKADRFPRLPFLPKSFHPSNYPGLLDNKRSPNKLSPTSVILSSWFLALVLFGLVFLAGTAIGAAFSGSKAPATSLAQIEVPTAHDAHHAHGKSAKATTPTHLTKAQQSLAKLEEWYSHADDATSDKASPKSSLGKQSKQSAKGDAEATSSAPKRLSVTDAKKVFDTQVNPSRNKQSRIDTREQAAKQSIVGDITNNMKTSKVAAALGSSVGGKSSVTKSAVPKTGHSFSPVKTHSSHMTRNAEAPTVMEIAARTYATGFDGLSSVTLLQRAMGNLMATEKFETLASSFDVTSLADDLAELDNAPGFDDIAKVITSEIFGDEVTKHPWEAGSSKGKSRKLLGSSSVAEKSSGAYALEFEQALGLTDGRTLVTFLPSVATNAPTVADEITAKGDDASDQEKTLAAVYDLTAVCARYGLARFPNPADCLPIQDT